MDLNKFLNEFKYPIAILGGALVIGFIIAAVLSMGQPGSDGLSKVVHDDTIHIKTDNTSYNGYIEVYTYNNATMVNGSFLFNDFFKPGFLFRDYCGNKNTVRIVNGTGSFKVTGDYFIIGAYGKMDKSVGFAYMTNDTISYIEITYNGNQLSNTQPYGNQFNIDNGGKVYYRNGDVYNGQFLLDNGTLID